MTEEFKFGCARPIGGPMNKKNHNNLSEELLDKFKEKKEEKVMIQVGKKAPDFTAPAYLNGKFVNIKLSDYIGKWLILCFYPGDFTFV